MAVSRGARGSVALATPALAAAGSRRESGTFVRALVCERSCVAWRTDMAVQGVTLLGNAGAGFGLG